MDKTAKAAINSEADKILNRYGSRYSRDVRDRVVSSLINQLGERYSLTLFSDDEKDLERRLTIDHNPYSRKTWLHLSFYNNLIADLSSSGKVKGRPLDIPRKVDRRLILTPQNNLDEHIHYIQSLHDDLIELRELPRSIKEAEIECVCSFIASAAIFAKITFPSFHQWILSIRYRDFHLGPDYINRQFTDSDAFYRYFLPYPANTYFMRCVLFYKKKYKLLGRAKPRWADDFVIQPSAFNLRTINKVFKTWLKSNLDLPENVSFSTAEFFRAVQAASLIDFRPGLTTSNRLPPFILSVQSDEIPCYSYRNVHLPDYLGLQVEPEHRYQAKVTTHILDKEYERKLKSAIHKIRDIRRSLIIKIDSIPERRNTIQRIQDFLNNLSEDISKDDVFNISLIYRMAETAFAGKERILPGRVS